MSYLYALSTGNPRRYVKGREAYHYFKKNWRPLPTQDALYQKVLIEGPIKGRHIGVEHDKLAALPDQDMLIAQFTDQARTVNRRVAVESLEQAHLDPSQIKAVVVNTCTGYLCPGLSSYLVQDLGLGADTKVFDLMGMGCGAAIPNLECASSLAHQCGGSVLSVAVEICSATIFDDPDPGCIISNCIFADGAAATVVTPAVNAHPPLAKVLDFETGVFPKYRDYLKFVSDQGKLRNVLSRRVPFIGAKTITHVAERLLERNNLKHEDIHHWAIHPGGTAVLEQVQKSLRLNDDAIRHSLHIFTHYGNMSSPSVLFVLERIFETAHPRSGQFCCMLSFGAGFTAHAALLEIP